MRLSIVFLLTWAILGGLAFVGALGLGGIISSSWALLSSAAGSDLLCGHDQHQAALDDILLAKLARHGACRAR